MTEVWSDGTSGASAVPHDLDLGAYDPALNGITIRGRRLVQDTRDLQPGDIFIAIGRPGAPALPFVTDAFARGAVAVLVDADAVAGQQMPANVYRLAGLATVLGG